MRTLKSSCFEFSDLISTVIFFVGDSATALPNPVIDINIKVGITCATIFRYIENPRAWFDGDTFVVSGQLQNYKKNVNLPYF